MSKSLYNIAAEYQLLELQLLESQDEATIEEQKFLQINKDEMTTKGQSYGFVLKSLDDRMEAAESEIKRIEGIVKRIKGAKDRLKGSLVRAMSVYGIEKIEAPLLTLSIGKSESVEIINEAQLDQKYMTEKITVTPNKTAIKNDIKAGVEVEGAVLVTNQNLQIK